MPSADLPTLKLGSVRACEERGNVKHAWQRMTAAAAYQDVDVVLRTHQVGVSIAVAHGKLFIRTNSRLYCIGKS